MAATRVFCRAATLRHQPVRAGGVKNCEYWRDNIPHDFETLTIATACGERLG